MGPAPLTPTNGTGILGVTGSSSCFELEPSPDRQLQLSQPRPYSIPSCFCCGAAVDEVLDLRMKEGLEMYIDKLAMSEHQGTCVELAKEEEVLSLMNPCR